MAWYDTNFAKRIDITTQSSQISTTDSDFVQYFDLSLLPSSFFSDIQSDGSDIRVTRGEDTALAFDLVFVDTGSETGEIHFRTDTDISSSDEIYYLYYDNSSASAPSPSDTLGRENVYGADTKGVWHSQASSSPFIDATANGNDATLNGVTTGATGQIGDAGDYDGTDDNLSWSSQLFEFDNISYSAWIKTNGNFSAGEGVVIAKEVDGPWLKLGVVDSTHMPRFTATSGTTTVDLDATTDVSDSNWHHIAGTYDGSTMRIYVDGVEENSDSSLSGTLDYSSETPRIGSQSSGNVGQYFDGTIDGPQIASASRNSNWWDSQYANQNDPGSWWSVGNVEVFSTEVADVRTASGTFNSTQTANGSFSITESSDGLFNTTKTITGTTEEN